eukprot:gene7887-9399_t
MDFAQDLLKMFVPSHATAPHCPLIAAITIGRSEAVAYISSIGVAGVEAMAAAAEYGRLDYLEMLYRHGHPWDYTAFFLKAAENGHLNCMKYAHEQGLRWHANTVPVLSEKGNLEILKVYYKAAIFLASSY